MTTHATRRPARKGTRAEAAAILADLRQIARPECDWPDCTRPAPARFAAIRLCDGHQAEAMATAYAMEGTL